MECDDAVIDLYSRISVALFMDLVRALVEPGEPFGVVEDRKTP
jgi:hypothetical protein